MTPYRKYLPESQSEGLAEMQPDWGITVLTAGHNKHPANSAYPDNDHPDPYTFNWDKGRVLDEFQLVYIAAGSGMFEAEKVGSVTVKPGTVFLLFPGVWHRYKPLRETGWEEYWVGFKGSYAHYLMNQDCFNPESPLIYMGFNAELLSIFIRLIDTLKSQNTAFSHMPSCLTIQLLGLVYASALLKEKSNNRKEQIINNIRYKLHENLQSNFSLEDFASSHNVSYVWFRKAFKEVTGESPGQYLLNLKIDKAAQLLKETTLSVSEIAFQTGFESESHFSRMFKQRNGVSPSVYRERKG